MTTPCRSSTCDLVVVGGGLAGLAAAEAASRAGWRVELLEAKPLLGGRASSFLDSETGQCVDFCQHVAMGCCGRFLEFCGRLGVADALGRFDRLNFIAPNGYRHEIGPAWWLPAPLHLLPGLMRLRYLSLGDRCRIIKGLSSLAGGTAGLSSSVPSDDPAATIGPWLRSHGQSPAAVDGFWSPILTSALSESPDRIALPAARHVFREGFLTSRHGYELILPQTPLVELFDRRAGQALQQRGVVIHRGARVRTLEGSADRVDAAVLSDGRRIRAQRFVLCVPWRHANRLIPPAMQAALAELQHIDQLPTAPITAVHLWFDRPLTCLPHAAFVGRVSQWLFRGNQASPASIRGQPSHYYQVVISASHALADRERVDVMMHVCRELAEVWPHSRHARVLHWRVVTRRSAVFTLQPGVDRLRPPQTTGIPNLYLAGDWTRTGWPATMEGAVRSGYMAVEAMTPRS